MMRYVWLISLCSIFISGCALQKQVIISSVPDGAEVVIDDITVGQTPLLKKLEFAQNNDEHNIVLKKSGFYDDHFGISMNPENLVKYERELQKWSKEISVTTSPNNAVVYINGKKTGVTPFKDNLYFDKNQRYEIKLSKDRYDTESFTVEYQPVDEFNYHFDLKEVKEIELELLDFVTEKQNDRVIRTLRPRKSLSLKEVIERSPNVKTVSRITNLLDSALNIGRFAISPDGTNLVYPIITKEDTGTQFSNLWRKKIGASSKTRVSFGKYLDADPCYDQQGQYLYFSSDRNSKNTSLWRIRSTAGGGITKITSGQAQDFKPSINDSNVIYASIPVYAESEQIWSVQKDGNIVTQLREGASPTLTPDGQSILFTRIDGRTGKTQIWSMDIEGGKQTLISNDFDVNDIDPVLSADGRFIAFTSDAGKDSKGRNNKDIWIMKMDGSCRTQLTTNGSVDDYPQWGPRGKYIYFRSNRGFQTNIWRLVSTLSNMDDTATAVDVSDSEFVYPTISHATKWSEKQIPKH